MRQEEFLNTLAQKGYDIGFGAKKNFSSYDIINKLPSWVGFISLAVGIIQIAYENIPLNKELSILLIFVGIAIMYLEVFKSKTSEFENEGIRLTQLFNSIRDLYYCAKSDTNFLYSNYETLYNNILNDFYSNNVSKQVFMSSWYAHFKFFYEMQTDWIVNELKLTFFKDKIPNSLKIILLVALILILSCLFYECIPSVSRFCK
ncbi:SLATT domain-containing protein [Flavobacterium ginsenosidimutans]|uniref:SLATT domain-containing protein n=1 Tax=Flavobacterium ginsenosidimutans TaxID=687844 RepID=UPI000DAD6264|nr:SLATT domain-containing protein [Flavobacterium ginsenosidimutans]KAF2337539.1 SLATT domain-containing protein [Flavobacterium ginsenosidimutans]